MARTVRGQGLLSIAVVLGAFAVAGGSWAGDRYGPDDDYQASTQYGYEATDGGYDRAEAVHSDGRVYSYSSQRFEGVEAVDPCAAQQRLIGHGCEVGGAAARGGNRVYEREVERGADDLDAVDPCDVQRRYVGRDCEEPRAHSHETRVYERADGRRDDNVEAIDPCVTQARVTGRGCEREDRRSYPMDRGAVVYRDREARVDRRVYEVAPEPADAYGRADDRYAYVESCRSVHARLGDQCPYDSREHFRSASCCDRYVDERPVWVEERLPDSFFVSDGGVGPGIVDFGGGGGGSFIEADNFAGSGSASASAAASASLSLAIAIHNHGMKPHPGKGGSWGGGSWGSGGGRSGGCGCKK